VLCPFPLYQILLSSKIYSENFKTGTYIERCGWAGKSPARQQAGGAEIPSDKKENPTFSNESEFVSNTTSAQTKSVQTFSLILPNLIHKSRRKTSNAEIQQAGRSPACLKPKCKNFLKLFRSPALRAGSLLFKNPF